MREYEALVKGLSPADQLLVQAQSAGTNGIAPTATDIQAVTSPPSTTTARHSMADVPALGNPLLPADVLAEAIPGSIRRTEHFLNFLKKIVEYLKLRMKTSDVQNETPLRFLHHIHETTALERKPLRFTYSRLSSLLQTLEVSSLQDYIALQDVANLATLVSTYVEGFAVIIEPKVSFVHVLFRDELYVLVRTCREACMLVLLNRCCNLPV